MRTTGSDCGSKVRAAPEHLDGNGIGLDPVGATRERLCHDVFEESAGPFRDIEVGARKDSFELGLNFA